MVSASVRGVQEDVAVRWRIRPAMGLRSELDPRRHLGALDDKGFGAALGSMAMPFVHSHFAGSQGGGG